MTAAGRAMAEAAEKVARGGQGAAPPRGPRGAGSGAGEAPGSGGAGSPRGQGAAVRALLRPGWRGGEGGGGGKVFG